MKLLPLLAVASALLALGLSATAQTPTTPSDAPSLTIYNENFAVVRQTLPLDLKAGLNHVTVNDITAHIEPDSIILRDPAGKRTLQIREQNYRADPLSQKFLLHYYEGKTISFQSYRDQNGKTETVQGKIISSGNGPYSSPYNQPDYYQPQTPSGQPIIEVDGKIQFGLPGLPLFPALPDDSIVKPTLDWTLETDKPGLFNADLAYISEGMTWNAAYNVVAPETDNGTMNMVGWVTMQNNTGKTFTNANIKLMAGDVNKISPTNGYLRPMDAIEGAANLNLVNQDVTEKAFDEYHLYTLPHPTTLRDGETKQVEFIHAEHIKYKQIYVYDGADIDLNQYNGWSYENIRGSQDYGTKSNTKVAVMREFVNSKANGLGIPLPKGRMRFYKQDTDGQLEFTGENNIDHTPKDETVRVYTGNAFDLTGERTQTNYKINNDLRWLDEAFSIKVSNHKTTPVDIRIVEHLYRGANWSVPVHSDPFVKPDAHTINFTVHLAPSEVKTVTYMAHYTW